MPEDSQEAPELLYKDVGEIEEKEHEKWKEMSDEDKLKSLEDI